MFRGVPPSILNNNRCGHRWGRVIAGSARSTVPISDHNEDPTIYLFAGLLSYVLAARVGQDLGVCRRVVQMSFSRPSRLSDLIGAVGLMLEVTRDTKPGYVKAKLGRNPFTPLFIYKSSSPPISPSSVSYSAFSSFDQHTGIGPSLHSFL